jgi:putative heme-binding domain-containing protein
MGVKRFSLLLGAAGVLLAQHSYTPADIEDGGRLFAANCVNCHGPEGDLVPGIDLAHGKFRRATTESDLILIIRNGIPGTAMPPHSMPEFMAGTIVAYLRSVATEGRSASTGNPATGKKIFEGKGNCLQCHRVNGTGSRLGPDLSEIGALRRVVAIERSIVDPNAEILPQNRFYRLVTKRGETVTGRLLNLDTFTIQLIDSKDRLLSFRRSDLRESGFREDSPMPSFRERLSATEREDVIAYLATLKGF